ncbi:hypothetical protein [Streptomyces sp. G45]|uniref:hypothetical protein n=1 Tax=Streptomyces sp. G45 TaxID=3406627 RepID=UPI003C1CAD55
MSTSPSTSSGRKPVEIRTIRTLLTVRGGLPPDSAELLSRVSRLRKMNRGRAMVLRAMRTAYFLVEGCVAELVQPGKIRMWREAMLFEAVTGPVPSPDPGSTEELLSAPTEVAVITAMSPCVLVEVPHTKLASLATADPAIALMLARMAAKRHTLTERLYGATRAAPVARVAAVLNYLAGPTRKNVVKPREEDGVLVMSTTHELVASGPSQADIADALCLGRATVEKAIAELRQAKALRSFVPGERANRCYPIADQDLLRQIALGG